jgi:hypothetical protein
VLFRSVGSLAEVFAQNGLLRPRGNGFVMPDAACDAVPEQRRIPELLIEEVFGVERLELRFAGYPVDISLLDSRFGVCFGTISNMLEVQLVPTLRAQSMIQ